LTGLEAPQAARSVRSAARSGSGWYAALARAGLVAKGISFGIVGILAIEVAIGSGGKATSREGALQSLAHHASGKVLLILLALGFAGYAAWRFVQALAADEDDEAKTWAKRAGYAGRGLVYAGLTFSTVKILTGSGAQQSQNGKAHETAAMVLSWPAGTWLVGAAGGVVIGVGLWNAYRGVTKKFEDKWETGRMNGPARTWGARVGVAGHLARGLVFALIGVFAIKAAVDYNPKDAIGLDGALQKLAHQSYGPFLLGLTAAGLVCYALYGLFDARYRDVSA
jgi:hypothetical protein